MKQTIYEIPYLLSFAGNGKFKPGRGEAGWAVARFTTADAALSFMQSNKPSAMPCWKRLDSEGIEIFKARL